jgi:hypothetical protein
MSGCPPTLGAQRMTARTAFSLSRSFAEVAQRSGRANYGSEGWGFESLRAHDLRKSISPWTHSVPRAYKCASLIEIGEVTVREQPLTLDNLRNAGESVGDIASPLRCLGRRRPGPRVPPPA